MIDYYQEIAALFDIYENEEHLTEKEIYQRCLLLIKNHNFDPDYMWSINDVSNNRGYCFQFVVEKNAKKQFDSGVYNDLMTNTTKSKNKTEELINYLNDVDDYRLSFASLHALKTKYLIELGLLPNDNEWINSFYNDSFRDLLFKSFIDHYEINDILMDVCEKMGLKYIRLGYMQFWLDMEWLLWTIELADQRNGHIKVNTIKVAFCIAPKIFFERENKIYYDTSFSSKLNSYLKLIDKDLLKIMKDRYEGTSVIEYMFGYSALFKTL